MDMANSKRQEPTKSVCNTQKGRPPSNPDRLFFNRFESTEEKSKTKKGLEMRARRQSHGHSTPDEDVRG
ncbi:hypothetical protein AnigIFM60653_002658 [Aspergillus niger]|nr:hypothetical protein AnigIFM60653_002658 [Aspergillus niger]